MRTPRIAMPVSVTALAAALVITGLSPVMATSPQPPLGLPEASTREIDRALVTADEPHVGPASYDADAAGEAALAQVDRFGGPDWDIEELAASLGTEAEAAFAFVRDRIGFDPYPGVLRGAHGTLVARAGNAWDRALLLQELLRQQGREARLATGLLAEAAVESILERSLSPAPPSPDDPPASDVIGIDLESLSTRAHRDYARLSDGLGEEAERLGVGATSDLAAAIGEHAWVQV